jgi:hypothetical protein
MLNPRPTDVYDFSNKAKFVYEGSVLYHRMTCYADSDVIRRFLAFRIVVNSISFVDLFGSDELSRLREIRDVFLVHKENKDFLLR